MIVEPIANCAMTTTPFLTWFIKKMHSFILLEGNKVDLVVMSIEEFVCYGIRRLRATLTATEQVRLLGHLLFL